MFCNSLSTILKYCFWDKCIGCLFITENREFLIEHHYKVSDLEGSSNLLKFLQGVKENRLLPQSAIINLCSIYSDLPCSQSHLDKTFSSGQGEFVVTWPGFQCLLSASHHDHSCIALPLFGQDPFNTLFAYITHSWNSLAIVIMTEILTERILIWFF